jgi:tetratricopeptide (TPR) repeat protein
MLVLFVPLSRAFSILLDFICRRLFFAFITFGGAMIKRTVFSGVLFFFCFSLLFGCGGMIKGEMKLNQKKYEEAIPFFKEVLAKNPGNIRAGSKLGFAYLKTGRIDFAINQLENVLIKEPAEPFATLYLGMAYLNNGEMGKAISIWNGYRNAKQPLVEAEIKRQLTLLQIAESQRMAQAALIQEQQLGAVTPDSKTLAVCYYADLSPDKSLRAFQKGLVAMVISDLSKIKSVKIVERVRLQALLAEMKLGQTGIVDVKTAPRIGRLLGADKLVVGALAQGSIAVTTTMTSASQGGVMGTASLTVEQDNFFEIPASIVSSVAEIAGIDLSAEESQAIGVPQTKSFQAVTFYGLALEAIDAGNWSEALDLFSKAAAEDPGFALASQGREGCPGGSSPSPAGLAGMSVAQVSATVEGAVEKAESDQSSADRAAKDISGTDGDGNDGGGGGGDGGGCFIYDTQVLMGDNTLKRIIDLREGDMVAARDMVSGKSVVRRVTDTYRADQDHYYLINGTLKITATHPVYIAEGRWVNVSDLKIGDVIYGFNGTKEIGSLSRVEQDNRVYNFRVEDSHNYFVTAHGTDYFLVHNSKGH